jgi:stage II sporulation protein D
VTFPVLRRLFLLAAFAALASAGWASSLLASRAAHAAKISDDATTTAPSTAVATNTTPTFTTLPTVLGAPPIVGTTPVATTAALTSATTTTPAATVPATTTTTPQVATSTAAATLVFTGHGWGHGIGMSQWGAYGYALNGWTYDRILAHYYTGTTLGKMRSPVVRVLLVDGAKRVTLGCDAAWQVVDANGTSVALAAGPLLLTPKLTIGPTQLVSPLTFTCATAPLEVGSKPYHGKLTVTAVGSKLQVVNAVGAEQYVDGVVPSEVPSTWPAEALKAQAVAARSYALANLTTVVTASNFDLYSDTRSQVYGGIAAETPATTAAVAATARQVVLYDSKVATTYFSSSSGGRTVSAQEAWGKPVPYLVSVADPYDTYSPNHDWGPVLFDAAKAAKALGVQGLSGLTMTAGPSDHVLTVTATGAGEPVTLTGSALQADLGLRSTWFSVGMLVFTPPATPIAFGGTGTLSGTVRGVSDVTIEGRLRGGTWTTVQTVAPGADGAFSVAVSPASTTQYRFAAGGLHAGLVTVAVKPLVQATVATGTVQGTVRPAIAGSPVQLQLQAGRSWTTVATGTTDSAGAFAVAAALSPGSYRVRSAPGHGLSPGVSLLLPVQ